MAAKLSSIRSSFANRGQMNFLTRAANQLSAWFGPHCDNDPARIASMSAREWQAMGDLEKKPFIESEISLLESADGSPGGNRNGFLAYLLERHYNLKDKDQNHSDNAESQPFDRNNLKKLAQDWKLLSKEAKSKYVDEQSPRLHHLAMDHVINQRAKLHEIYQPRQLSTLEFILKVKPRLPWGARVWYFKENNLSISSQDAKLAWEKMDQEKRELYEKCSLLDKKRYSFEMKAWMMKLLTVDFDSDDLTVEDFQSPVVKHNQENIQLMFQVCRDIPKSMIGIKRPREPFSLFIEAYRYQIRDERPEFQFGKHLRECGEAWAKLSEEEKDVYRLQSKQLKEARRELMKKELNVEDPKTLTIDYFDANQTKYGPSKLHHLLPTKFSAKSLWKRENKITEWFARKQWHELSESEKAPYVEQHERLKESIEAKKKELKVKMKFIKGLLREANELQLLKRKLKLLKMRNM